MYKLIASLFLSVSFINLTGVSFAEIVMDENERHVYSASPYFRTDFVAMDNNVDLDSKKRDDRVSYIGIDYSLGLDLKAKNDGPEIFLKLERNGPYDYDAPIIINNTLMTYVGKVRPYHKADLLPQIEEMWTDVPLFPTPFRVKGGLYTYSVGHEISLGGSYENYGITLYTESEDFKWRFYYCWPDIANKELGPLIKQEKEQGIDYYHSKSYFFATDATIPINNITVQPYVGMLFDKSDGKRLNYFTTPTNEDLLGTVGAAIDFVIGKLSLSFEIAKNFGKATSSDAHQDDVEHRGYMIYADASYEFDKFTPHTRFLFASGNKLTDDMITNGDTTYTSTKNNAFSVYSPFNANLQDSIYSNIDTVPLVAMGNGNGLNYGIPRPTTFLDPIAISNLILFNIGFDWSFTEKASFTFDWWYLSSVEKGMGMYNYIPKVISPDLGHECDLSLNYAITKNATLSILSGVFFPGAAYREERDDTAGSLFTPFVRGDGKADPAYQIEVSMELCF